MKSILSLIVLLCAIIMGIVLLLQPDEGTSPVISTVLTASTPNDCAGNDIVSAFTNVFAEELTRVRGAKFDESQWDDLILLARSEASIQKEGPCKVRMENFIETILVEQSEKREQFKSDVVKAELATYARIIQVGDWKRVDGCLANLKAGYQVVNNPKEKEKVQSAIRQLEKVQWVMSDTGTSTARGELDELLSQMWDEQMHDKMRLMWDGFLEKWRDVYDLVERDARPSVDKRREFLSERRMEFVSFAIKWKKLFPLYVQEGGRTNDMRLNNQDELSAEEISKYAWYKQRWLSEMGSVCPDSDIESCRKHFGTKRIFGIYN